MGIYDYILGELDRKFLVQDCPLKFSGFFSEILGASGCSHHFYGILKNFAWKFALDFWRIF